MALPRALAAAAQGLTPAPSAAAVGDSLVAVLVLGLPLVGAVILATLYWRVRSELRRRELEAPLFLLPYLSAASTAHAPPLWDQKVDAEDLEAEHQRQMELDASRRRAQRLLFALGADALLIWVVGAWYLGREKPVSPSEGSAVLYAIVDSTSIQSASSASDSPRPFFDSDTVAARLLPPTSPPQRDLSPPTKVRVEPPRQTRAAVSPQGRDSSPPMSGVARPVLPETAPEVTHRDSVAASTPAPPTAPPAAGDPSGATRQPAGPPPPDPATERARALEALTLSVRNVVGEINGRRGPGAALEDPGSLRRFTDWVKQHRPSATAAGLDDVVVQGDRAEGAAGITLRWRDDFGVGKQRTIRFRIGVDRSSGDWRYSGVQLLERFP